jgi:hypothetical protein
MRLPHGTRKIAPVLEGGVPVVGGPATPGGEGTTGGTGAGGTGDSGGVMETSFGFKTVGSAPDAGPATQVAYATT